MDNMSRHALSDQHWHLTDEQWASIAPLIPERTSRRGRPRNDDRKTLNGILYVLKNGCAWQDLPPEYGSGTTCWRRLQEWSADGIWGRIWRTLFAQPDAQDAWASGRTSLDDGAAQAQAG